MAGQCSFPFQKSQTRTTNSLNLYVSSIFCSPSSSYNIAYASQQIAEYNTRQKKRRYNRIVRRTTPDSILTVQRLKTSKFDFFHIERIIAHSHHTPSNKAKYFHSVIEEIIYFNFLELFNLVFGQLFVVDLLLSIKAFFGN